MCFVKLNKLILVSLKTRNHINIGNEIINNSNEQIYLTRQTEDDALHYKIKDMNDQMSETRSGRFLYFPSC